MVGPVHLDDYAEKDGDRWHWDPENRANSKLTFEMPPWPGCEAFVPLLRSGAPPASGGGRPGPALGIA
jgi:hypothetical protein